MKRISTDVFQAHVSHNDSKEQIYCKGVTNNYKYPTALSTQLGGKIQDHSTAGNCEIPFEQY